MGVDCVFFAENRNAATLDDLERAVASGKYPGGKGALVRATRPHRYELTEPLYAYHWVAFHEGWVQVDDGCRRYRGDPRYQLALARALRHVFGGPVYLSSDGFLDVEEWLEFGHRKLLAPALPHPDLRVDLPEPWEAGVSLCV